MPTFLLPSTEESRQRKESGQLTPHFVGGKINATKGIPLHVNELWQAAIHHIQHFLHPIFLLGLSGHAVTLLPMHLSLEGLI